MKLKRNETADGLGKYAVIKLDRVASLPEPQKMTVEIMLDFFEKLGVLTYGSAGAADEFFVLMIKDDFARPALCAYADAAGSHDAEYAEDVFELARRAGCNSPFRKIPD